MQFGIIDYFGGCMHPSGWRWLKHDGQPILFNSRESAQARADELNKEFLKARIPLIDPPRHYEVSRYA